MCKIKDQKLLLFSQILNLPLYNWVSENRIFTLKKIIKMRQKVLWNKIKIKEKLFPRKPKLFCLNIIFTEVFVNTADFFKSSGLSDFLIDSWVKINKLFKQGQCNRVCCSIIRYTTFLMLFYHLTHILDTNE